jgi:Flp pilus assembly pilin Flp
LRGLIYFCKSERGQDLVEYALMMAFLTLVGAAVFVGMGNTTSGLWSVVNSRLAANNSGS